MIRDKKWNEEMGHKLWCLFEKLVQTFLVILSDDSDRKLKAQELSVISAFLKQNGIILDPKSAADQYEALEGMKERLKSLPFGQQDQPFKLN